MSFSFCTSNTNKCQYIVFKGERHNRQILILLIQKLIKAETMLHSDEWAVYNTDCLEQLGYLHESVNHYIEYVHEGDWFLL